MSVSLTNMGMLATARGDLQQALERFVEAHALAEEVGDPWVVAVGRHNLGNVTRDLGDLDEAAGHFVPALDAYAEHDDRWSLAHVFEDVAVWLLARGPAGDAEAVSLLAAAERPARGDRRPALPAHRGRARRGPGARPRRARRPTCSSAPRPSGAPHDLDLTVRRAGLLLSE